LVAISERTVGVIGADNIAGLELHSGIRSGLRAPDCGSKARHASP